MVKEIYSIVYDQCKPLLQTVVLKHTGVLNTQVAWVISAFDGHQKNLNWQATTSFAEEGKRKTAFNILTEH
jgi:hypothetical protein